MSRYNQNNISVYVERGKERCITKGLFYSLGLMVFDKDREYVFLMNTKCFWLLLNSLR